MDIWRNLCFVYSLNLSSDVSFFQSRESFNASREDIHALMRKMLEVRTNSVRLH